MPLPIPTPDDARRIKRAVEGFEANLTSSASQSGDRVYADGQTLLKMRITDDDPVTGDTGQDYYRAFTLIYDPQVSEFIDHAQVWASDPNRAELSPGICLGQESGTFLGLPVLVPTTAGVASLTSLTVEGYTGGDVVLNVRDIQFHTPPFIVGANGANTVLIAPRWGADADVRPVGTANDNGTIEAFARVNHAHALVIPPGPLPPNPLCGQAAGQNSEGFYVYDCDTETWNFLCWCFPSGSGSGGGGTASCFCAQCPGGMPPRFLVEITPATGDWISDGGVWTFTNVGGCHYTLGEGTFTGDLDYDTASGLWLMKFEDSATGIHWYMYNLRPFQCCAENLFIVYDASDFGTHGGLADTLAITPDGPCSPCGGASGGGGAPNACCPDDTVDDHLQIDFLSGTGTCACADAIPSVNIYRDYSIILPTWRGTFTSNGCPGTGRPTSTIELHCGLGGWKLACMAPAGFPDPGITFMMTSSTSEDCPNNEFVFDIASPGGCTGGFAAMVHRP